ncbi:MAG: hypothetical protein CJD30_07515 [Sulfuricurvum sp. PD_MW2]|uniref:hypothetical protein n=1 Tax=Sulfuricurvum sp. PD_MW2 TaxID=2027917 RepID=UPI000C0622EC|nr:hypothetical protein [Sulfuricurvum sp. PD_MW2]PHM17234.1 MAG: hypothetical protein CJD30_07515 [Sulfuricurvum sp. PD_MW2]
MKALALFICLIGQLLIAEPSVLTDPQAAEPSAQSDQGAGSDINSLFSGVHSQSGLKLEFTNLPSRPYIGEIIAVNVKLTPVDLASGNIEYTLNNESGVRIFSDTPKRKVKEDGVYDTFYFLVQSQSIRLPDITATLTSTGATSETLSGSSFNATTLSPPNGFANVLADKFTVINYKTTPYNNESNVVIFTVKASRCNISDFSIPNAIKQGFESKLSNVGESQMTYYAIIPNTEQNLVFSYFNLQKQRYESVTIPIQVDDDTVSTGQNDLSPTDARHTELKVGGAAVTILMLFGMFYWRRNKTYLYLAALPMFYVVYALLPNQKLCVKKDAPVYLLPIKNGTIFEMTLQEEHLESEKEVGDFIKVHLSDDKVGWINKRDICTN